MGEWRRQRLAGLEIPDSTDKVPPGGRQLLPVRGKRQPIDLVRVSHRLANPFSGLSVKNLRAIIAGSNHPPPVLAETGARKTVGRFENQSPGLTSLHLPDLHRTILGRGDDELTVRIESQIVDRAFVLERLTHGQPGKGIPQSNYATLRTSGQPLPVRAQAEDRKGSFRLDWLANRLAGSDIPDSHRSVIGSTDEAASVRAEFDVQDLIVVGLKLLEFSPAPRVPQGNPTSPSSRQYAAVGTEVHSRYFLGQFQRRDVGLVRFPRPNTDRTVVRSDGDRTGVPAKHRHGDQGRQSEWTTQPLVRQRIPDLHRSVCL